MTLYMPLLWILAQGGDQLRRVSGSHLADVVYLGVHLAIGLLLVSRIAVLLQDTAFEKVSYAF
jgi:hypothetical protein